MNGRDPDPPSAPPATLAKRDLGEAQALGRRLLEAAPEELLSLVLLERETLEPGAALQALRNPHAGREVVAAIAESPRLLATYEVKKAVAAHPRSPEPLALALAAGLYWPDLLSLAADVRVRPTVRRAAEQALVGRLPRMAAGEKESIARRAVGEIARALRADPSPQVVAALLGNPRLTEGDVAPGLASENPSRPFLEQVARHPRWGVRPGLRALIVKNPRTPQDLALGLLPRVGRDDLRAVAQDPRIAPPVRQRARELLG